MEVRTLGNRNLQSDRISAVMAARKLLDTPGWLLFDTETTGLDNKAQIIEICIAKYEGALRLRPILDVRICPTVQISEAASAVHGINIKDLQKCPRWPDIDSLVSCLFSHNQVLAYNIDFDMRLLKQTANAHGKLFPDHFSRTCLMHLYAQFMGEWDERHQSYRWQKLNGGHSAASDVQAAFYRIREMADSATS